MEIAPFTKARCPDLARFLDDCCETPLSFESEFPIMQSAANHIHLWALEYWADHHDWIDQAYRTKFAESILARWRSRLKGYQPYQTQGFRLYLYEDMAPTVSVVAETERGCPYGGALTFVPRVADVMARYDQQSWAQNFSQTGSINPEHVLAAIRRHNGSIGKPTAQTLGLQVGVLRKVIEWYDLTEEVNNLRKHFGRRPAQFRSEEIPPAFHIWEEKLPAGY